MSKKKTGQVDFFAFIRKAPEIAEIFRFFQRESQLVHGVPEGAAACLVAALWREKKPPAAVVTATEGQAREIKEDLTFFLPEEDVIYFPPPEPIFPGMLATSRGTRVERTKGLNRLAAGSSCLVVAPVEALLRRLPPFPVYREFFWEVEVGQRVELERILSLLVRQGYERVEMVEEPGQFSLRGGILDVFAPEHALPVRIELFDDEVDSLRFFHPETQRSLASTKKVSVGPAREGVCREEEAAATGRLRQVLAEKLKSSGKKGREGEERNYFSSLLAGVEKLAAGLYPEETEIYLPLLYPQSGSFFDFLPAEGAVFLYDPERIGEKIAALEQERVESPWNPVDRFYWAAGAPGLYWSRTDIAAFLSRRPFTAFSLLPKNPRFLSYQRIINAGIKQGMNFAGRPDLLAEELRSWTGREGAAVLLAGTAEGAKRLQEQLRGEGILAILAEEAVPEPRPGQVVIGQGNLSYGFVIPAAGLLVAGPREVLGRRKKRTVREREREESLKLPDLKPGDYVVHEHHGIGRYDGITRMEIGGIQRDYLVIRYAGEDTLYLPVDQIGLLKRYSGLEGRTPRLNRLGGQEWARVKNRVKASVQELARQLLELYAEREKIQGYAFSPDTVWQKEFEESFPYEDTPDQKRATEEIKRDMEKPRPMDRLLCGDVGFGKTEVALRAAFKAVMDGKQVAVLVPTTVLAQQHYLTFRQRLAGYPVEVEMLSRFRTPREQKKIIEKLKKGQIDIVIGTHRLLQKDVGFKDLGLLIIDEEQRFGVAHKEKIKMMKKNVDVLTMTATPIPRTLHMALAGMRDMSLLNTPPEDRFPVQTYVVEYNPVLIREAIERELDRQGQVFFVHNRVQDIDQVAWEVRELVPRARVLVAHGQMEEEELENRMMAFLNREYDVLVCTTIIEAGLDMPNVNTLIVDEADNFGLAQLYQLRGRVGRSNRVAYAYFTYRKDKLLSEEAEKRLQAIREFTELGSGLRIALRDLEIRGAGNILGPEQSGHMVAVGFDMYCHLLEEAVRELKGEEKPQHIEPVIELKVNAYIAENYIADQATRVEIYRKIMRIASQKDLQDLLDELVDRFGEPPQPVVNLLQIALIKALAREVGIQAVREEGRKIVLEFAEQHPVTGEMLVKLAEKDPQKITFDFSSGFTIRLEGEKKDEEGRLQEVTGILQELAEMVKISA